MNIAFTFYYSLTGIEFFLSVLKKFLREMPNMREFIA